jgi:hypothetical protein
MSDSSRGRRKARTSMLEPQPHYKPFDWKASLKPLNFYLLVGIMIYSQSPSSESRWLYILGVMCSLVYQVIDETSRKGRVATSCIATLFVGFLLYHDTCAQPHNPLLGRSYRLFAEPEMQAPTNVVPGKIPPTLTHSRNILNVLLG